MPLARVAKGSACARNSHQAPHAALQPSGTFIQSVHTLNICEHMRTPHGEHTLDTSLGALWPLGLNAHQSGAGRMKESCTHQRMYQMHAHKSSAHRMITLHCFIMFMSCLRHGTWHARHSQLRCACAHPHDVVASASVRPSLCEHVQRPLCRLAEPCSP